MKKLYPEMTFFHSNQIEINEPENEIFENEPETDKE